MMASDMFTIILCVTLPLSSGNKDGVQGGWTLWICLIRQVGIEWYAYLCHKHCHCMIVVMPHYISFMSSTALSSPNCHIHYHHQTVTIKLSSSNCHHKTIAPMLSSPLSPPNCHLHCHHQTVIHKTTIITKLSSQNYYHKTVNYHNLSCTPKTRGPLKFYTMVFQEIVHPPIALSNT